MAGPSADENSISRSDIGHSEDEAGDSAGIRDARSPARLGVSDLGFRAVELLAACTLAIAQPLLSLLGDNPVFFVAHGMTGSQLVSYALILTLVIPTVLFVIVTALSFVAPRVGAITHDGMLGVLIGATLAPPIARAVGFNAFLWLTLMVVIAVGAAVLLHKAAPARSFMRILGAAPILFVGFFLFASPASDLIGGGEYGAVPTLSDDQTAPVVWLVLDQFPMSFIVDANGEIVDERYPNLARLQELTTWYPNATAGTVSTDRSVPAALTGNWPEWSQLPVSSQQPMNLFTLLASEDYPIQAEEYVTQLCPNIVCSDAESGIDSTWADTRAVWVRHVLPESTADRFVPPIDDRWDGFGDRADADPDDDDFVEREARNRTEIAEIRKRADDNSVRFGRFMEPLAEPDLVGVHYAHLFLPHEPLRYLPDGRTMFLPWSVSVDDEGRWPDSEPAMRTRLQRAMTQTMFADRLVGELLDTLEAAGTLDEVALVVMSDHGASTRPDMLNRSDDDPDAAVDAVPLMLFIKEPHQSSGAIDERRVQQVDILPTVLDMLGVELTVHDNGTLIGANRSANDDVDFQGLVARGETASSSWEQRVPVRIHEDGISRIDNPPSAADSPTIDWIVDVFPDFGDPYVMRPFESFMRATIAPENLVNMTTADFSITLDAPDAFADVDTVAADLPASVTGIIEGHRQPLAVAVVVNNTIAGVTESFSLQGEHRFSVVIDPDVLINGSNDVQFLAVPMAELSTTPIESWVSVTIDQ